MDDDIESAAYWLTEFLDYVQSAIEHRPTASVKSVVSAALDGFVWDLNHGHDGLHDVDLSSVCKNRGKVVTDGWKVRVEQ